MQHEAGGPGGGGSSAGVKLQVDLGEAAGQDGGGAGEEDGEKIVRLGESLPGFPGFRQGQG